MSARPKLCRVTTHRPLKEARKGDRIGWQGVRGADILHSLSYWRAVCRSDPGAMAHYREHVREAMWPTLIELSVAETFAKPRAALASHINFDLHEYARQLLGVAA